MTLAKNQPQSLPQVKPLWRQPTAILTGLLGLGLIAYPIIQDSRTPRINSAFYADVSLSNREFAPSVGVYNLVLVNVNS